MIVIVAVALVEGHPPDAAIVFITVYVPGVLADKFTTPVAALIINPVDEENIPVVLPVFNTGVGLFSDWQYGLSK